MTSISSPFAGSSDGFTACLEVPGHEDWVTDVPDVDTLLDRAPWKFEFSFVNGAFSWKYRFQGVTGILVEPREVEKTGQPLLVQPERDGEEFGDYPGIGSSRPRPSRGERIVCRRHRSRCGRVLRL